MTKVYVNINTGQFHININESSLKSEIFNTIYLLLKNHYHLSYDSKLKEWYTKDAMLMMACLIDLQAYDTVEISEEDKEFIKDFIYPDDPEFKIVKKSIPADFIKEFPPLIGLPGKEDFQLKAMKKGIERNRLILDIAVRHGKTYITCGILYSMFQNNEVDKVLIVCRPEGLENFRIELLKFLHKYLTEEDIVIVDKKHRNIEEYFDKKIIISSYSTFRLSGAYYNTLKNKKSKARKPEKETINFASWGNKRTLILDEAQSINNHDSLQSHFLHLYKNNFYKRILLSGSLGYKFLKYYSLISFLLPNSLPYSFTVWSKYLTKSNSHPRDLFKPSNLKAEQVKEFKEKLIDKVQVSYHNCLPFTQNHENFIYIRMNEDMRKLYREFVESELKELLKDEVKVKTNKLIPRFPYLIQFTSDPTLLKDKFKIGAWKLEDNPKIDVLSSLIEKHVDENKEKIVIWCKSPHMINLLAEHYKSYNPYKIHGVEKTSVKRDERIDELNDFKKSTTRHILFSNYVLSTSISMVEATTQIFYDLPLDNDPFEQSKARITGPLQKKETNTYYLMFNNSVDIYIWKNLLTMKQNVKDILSSKEELDLEDYKEIFNAKV